MSIGLFGGTFDPIHIGHLDVARAVREALNLKQVMFVPAATPPHRTTTLASAAHRFAMVALALQHEPAFVVSDIEMGLEGPSYTARTLDRLAATGRDMRRVCFITGADAFRDVPTWKDFPLLLERCHFVAVSRPGVPAHSLRTALPALAPRMIEASASLPDEPRIILLEADTSPVSSTDARKALALGRSLRGIVPDVVAEYITRQQLYI